MFSANDLPRIRFICAEKWTRPRTLQFSCIQLPGALREAYTMGEFSISPVELNRVAGNMNLNNFLGIPNIEEAAPSGFASQAERELYAQIQAAIDRLRCPWCGSLAFETTLFVFSTGVEKLIECRACGNAHEEMPGKRTGHLAFLTGTILQGATVEE